jgi:hypothetical protein
MSSQQGSVSNDNAPERPFVMQSKGSDRLPPEYWQTRADKVPAIADEMYDPQSRQTLLRIATEYESLAERAQERERHSLASAEPVRVRALVGPAEAANARHGP